MELVREAVDDGNVRVLRKLVDVRLGEGADHDPVQVAGEDACGVLDRLAAPELEVAGGEVEGGAAELEHSDLERDAGARRGLLEDHPERSAFEMAVLDALAVPDLQPIAEVEDGE